MLKRQQGQYQDVSCLSGDENHWPLCPGVFQKLDLDHTSPEDITRLVNFAEDRERERRISCPFPASPEDEAVVHETADRLCAVHEELLHLFATHEVVEVFEKERERRMKEMQAMLDPKADDEHSVAMAVASAKLSKVHEDLKSAYKKMQITIKAKEREQRRRSEDLQMSRLRSASVDDEMEQERQRRLSENGERLKHPDKRLSQVQDQLLGIFARLKAKDDDEDGGFSH